MGYRLVSSLIKRPFLSLPSRSFSSLPSSPVSVRCHHIEYPIPPSLSSSPYSISNNDPPLLILHGLLGSSNNWRSIASRNDLRLSCPSSSPSPSSPHSSSLPSSSSFSSSSSLIRRIYGMDVRNHGNSDHSDSMNYRDMAADIIRVLDTVGIEKIILLGHSLGGKISMTTALEYPDRIAGLIVVDISPVPARIRSKGEIGGGEKGDGWMEVRSIIEALQSINLSLINSRDQVEQLLSSTIPDRLTRLFVLQNLLYENNQWKWRVDINSIYSSLDTIGGFPYEVPNEGLFYNGIQYSGPTLFIGGSQSPYLSGNHHLPIIQSLFPTVDKINWVSNSKHWVHMDNPTEFCSLVANFLKSI